MFSFYAKLSSCEAFSALLSLDSDAVTRCSQNWSWSCKVGIRSDVSKPVSNCLAMHSVLKCLKYKDMPYLLIKSSNSGFFLPHVLEISSKSARARSLVGSSISDDVLQGIYTKRDELTVTWDDSDRTVTRYSIYGIVTSLETPQAKSYDLDPVTGGQRF